MRPAPQVRSKLGLVVGAALALAFAQTIPSWAVDFATCVMDAAARNAEASNAFQTSLRDLIAEAAPQFEPLATVMRDLQITFAEARKAKLRYLLAHDPARIVTDRGLVKFTNFDWDDTDKARFADQDGEYRALEEKLAELAARNNGHPDWQALRPFFQNEIAPGDAYRALITRLVAAQGEVARQVATCER